MTIRDIAERINQLSCDYEIGNLRQIRKNLHPRLTRMPPKEIFTNQTIFEDDDYAFHFGGRNELQINIGLIEGLDDSEFFRYGIGLSFERGINLQAPLVTMKKQFIRLRQFLAENQDRFTDCSLYYHDDLGRHYISPNQFISRELNNVIYRVHNFIFFGKKTPATNIDYHDVMLTLDRLLEIYVFVEGSDELEPNSELDQVETIFPERASHAFARISSNTIEINLRHNVIQGKIFNVLSREFGAGSVRYERDTGYGNRIDLVVRHNQNCFYYEIKTYPLAKDCIREALGQLLEYAYFSNNPPAQRLIIIGEAPLTEQLKNYLRLLRRDFHLNVYYQQFFEDTDSLSPIDQ